MGIEAHTPPSPFKCQEQPFLGSGFQSMNSLMVYLSLPLEQACRIQNLPPPDPSSWYTNQLFSSCRRPETSGNLS